MAGRQALMASSRTASKLWKWRSAATSVRSAPECTVGRIKQGGMRSRQQATSLHFVDPPARQHAVGSGS
eukprot:scaffold1499_cov255-Pinguiococcus_pyrenoidosus.AAC.43